MVTEDQSAVISYLASPAAHGGAAVEQIETHASVVFLAGPRAWKLKRAVRYDYLDFSTAPRRRQMCEAEVQINRRTAPALYRGVVPVTRQPDGSLALGGVGEPVDWLIEMDRFDQNQLLDRLAAAGALNLGLMGPLAAAIADFHQRAAKRPDQGGAWGMTWVVDGNDEGFREQGTSIFEPEACRDLIQRSHQQLSRHDGLLEARRRAGFVRQCHGDLHLRNIVRFDGRPTLFDAIEFNDQIACVDVLYDLAFLLMDLWRRELPRHANAVWNGYLAQTADRSGIPLLPLFLSCRAAVRAKTNATSAQLASSAPRQRELQGVAREYLAMARRLIDPVPPRLIAIGGLSGSGKSTVARALAPFVGACPGAVMFRSDEIRKHLCGVEPLQRLGAEGYTSAVSTRVYSTLAQCAAEVVHAGHSAIVDAVYGQLSDRDAIEKTAAAAGVPFVGLWLEAPERVLTARVSRREHDASDADAAVIRQQITRYDADLTWHRVDATPTADVVIQTVREYVGEP